jgi:hypothetical protein
MKKVLIVSIITVVFLAFNWISWIQYESVISNIILPPIIFSLTALSLVVVEMIIEEFILFIHRQYKKTPTSS